MIEIIISSLIITIINYYKKLEKSKTLFDMFDNKIL